MQLVLLPKSLSKTEINSFGAVTILYGITANIPIKEINSFTYLSIYFALRLSWRVQKELYCSSFKVFLSWNHWSYLCSIKYSVGVLSILLSFQQLSSKYLRCILTGTAWLMSLREEGVLFVSMFLSSPHFSWDDDIIPCSAI